MKNIVMFGAPGAGKGTQGSLLAGRYRLAHISTGELLRTEIHKQTPFGLLAKELTDNGQLVPDEDIFKLLSAEYKRCREQKKGVIFDGYPRTLAQADTLKNMLNEYGDTVTAMIELTAPEEELITRIEERGKASGRTDDNRETARERLKVYHDTTMPLIKYYQEEGVHHKIDGHGTIDDIFKQICKVIDNL